MKCTQLSSTIELSLSLVYCCRTAATTVLFGSKDDRSWTVRTSGERLSAFVSVIVKPKQTMTESGSDGLFISEVQLAYRVNCHGVISTGKLFLDLQTASCWVCCDCEGSWVGSTPCRGKTGQWWHKHNSQCQNAKLKIFCFERLKNGRFVSWISIDIVEEKWFLVVFRPRDLF
jgi:hypothetical protein